MVGEASSNRAALSRTPTSARLLIGALSIVIVVWLAILFRDTVISEPVSGQALSTWLEDPQNGGFPQAERDLNQSRLLNPVLSPDLALAYLYLIKLDTNKATQMTESVISQEPENPVAWRLLLTIGHWTNNQSLISRATAALNRILRPLPSR